MLHELANGRGIRAVIWAYGATLTELWVPDRDGREVNVAVGFPDLDSYKGPRNQYLGATLGRYSRNVAFGRFSLDGVEFQLDRNDGEHHIHGGRSSFSHRMWEVEAGSSSLTLRLVSPDGDQGYPGEVTAEVVYRLGDSGIEFEYRAVTTAPTIVDLTNHTYWNLAGAGTIGRHSLRIGASQTIGFANRLAGWPAPVHDTDFDFTRARPLFDTPIDRFFVLDGPCPAAELAHPESGRTMRIITDAPGFGVYTADRFVRPRAGICLQASALPDAPNRPDFPSVRLDPGQVYRRRTVHEFGQQPREEQ